MFLPIFISTISEWEICHPPPSITYAHTAYLQIFIIFRLLIFANLLVVNTMWLVIFTCIFVIASVVNYLFLLFSHQVFLFCLFFYFAQVPLYWIVCNIFIFIFRCSLYILETYICTLYMCQISFNILNFKFCL